MTNPRERHDNERGETRHMTDSIHDDAARTTDPEALWEMRQVVALLRALPDPEPPAGLSARVLAYIDAQQSGAWRRIWRTGVAPVLGSALAAGVAGLMFFSTLQPAEPRTDLAWQGPALPVVAQRGAGTSAAGAAPLQARRPSVAALSSPAVVAPQVVFFGGPTLPEAAPEFAPLPSNAIERGLDRQLNLMLLDPGAFFQRLETVRDRDRFVARLAARAAKRGDAPQLALRLRPVDHRFAQTTSEQFLKASLVEYSSQR